MKRFVLILCVALSIFPLSGTALSTKTASDVKSNLTSLVRRYRDRSGFEVVKFGDLMLGGIRVAMKAAAKEDPELKAGVQLLSGIKRMWVVDFEEASHYDARLFSSEVEKDNIQGRLEMSKSDELAGED